MKVNERGLDIMKRFEGWSSEPYLDPIGIPTIGYGSIWDLQGDRVTMNHRDITKEEGTLLMRRELSHIYRAIDKLITYPINENQFSALVSFTYNLGSGRLQSSTLRQKLNRGDVEGAAGEFPKWRRAGGKIFRGLVLRRAEERDLFLS